MSEESPRTYRIAEAARLLGIGKNQAYQAARNGQIPSIRVGKLILIPKVALDQMLTGKAA